GSPLSRDAPAPDLLQSYWEARSRSRESPGGNDAVEPGTGRRAPEGALGGGLGGL
ncbi:MAG: hypothetical protein AVDCRST_MAG93-846, partial [uncultured Chloroflexia bacterium]